MRQHDNRNGSPPKSTLLMNDEAKPVAHEARFQRCVSDSRHKERGVQRNERTITSLCG